MRIHHSNLKTCEPESLRRAPRSYAVTTQILNAQLSPTKNVCTGPNAASFNQTNYMNPEKEDHTKIFMYKLIGSNFSHLFH